MKILQENNKPLLHRKDYELELEYDASTPSNADVKKKLSALLKHEENLIVIKHIYPRYGEKKASVFASLYKDEASLKSIEEHKKKVKKDGKEKGQEQKAK